MLVLTLDVLFQFQCMQKQLVETEFLLTSVIQHD